MENATLQVLSKCNRVYIFTSGGQTGESVHERAAVYYG